MPFEIAIDPAQELGLVWMWGEVNGEEILEANYALYSHEGWRPHYREWWDGRGARTLLLEWQDLQRIAKLETSGVAASFTGDVVVVARRNVLVAMAKAFIVLVRRKARHVQIYHTEEEAHHGLGLVTRPVPPEACRPFLQEP